MRPPSDRIAPPLSPPSAISCYQKAFHSGVHSGAAVARWCLTYVADANEGLWGPAHLESYSLISTCPRHHSNTFDFMHRSFAPHIINDGFCFLRWNIVFSVTIVINFPLHSCARIIFPHCTAFTPRHRRR